MTDEIQKPKIEGGNSRPETGNPESGIRNPESAAGSAVLIEEPPVVDQGQSAVPDASPLPKSKPKPSITLPLLLEVGCEEIPARFLRDAERSLGERVHAALFDAGLIKGLDMDVVVSVPGSGFPDIDLSPRRGKAREVHTYSTPRRLVVHVPALMAQQPDKVEEIVGPPVKVAFTSSPDVGSTSVLDLGASASPTSLSTPVGTPVGSYSRAAISFVQKNSARLSDLTRKKTPKGEYLSLRKTTPGRPAAAILAEILPGAILGLTFPKSMYWTKKSDPRFVRPIRWIVALLGEGKSAATVDFTILGVKTGNFTFGHRAKSSKPIPVNGFRNYSKKLAQALVEVDYNKRKEHVMQAALAVGDPVAGKIVQDEWLVDWIANSTEWQLPMLGSFDERFLHLPREILITVMRDHQRYFAVEDEQGNLRPHFVALLNMASDEQGLIRQGHQRVLTARFRDAEFFWTADQKIPLRDRVPLLDKVTYQARLGSYGAKVNRTKVIVNYICAILEKSSELKPEQTAHVLRAVELCKCDLTAQMVQEFTELQGIVGGLYAKAQGEREEVATAIYDHYLPAGAEGNSPRTLVGAIVSLADKVDSVVAGFAAGYEPTGSSDPFALRRQANGIIKVTLENSLPINLEGIIEISLGTLEIEWRKPKEEVKARVFDFFAERLRYYFESVRGFRYDTVRAVVAAGSALPADAQTRAEAMEALRGGEDFEALSAAAKRIRNILAKSATASDWQAGDVAPGLLTEAQEKELAEAYGKVAAEVDRRRAAREYRQALEEISTLRPAVDRFFDAVLVMAEDREVRQNRLRLLKKLDELFSGIAHFAEIAQGQ